MVIKANASLPLKWHGGKQYLAKKVIEMFPEHIHYVETHFGGGAVLFSKPIDLIENHSEVVNDINGDLMNFWEVLQSPRQFSKFKRQLEATPFSKSTWERCRVAHTKNDVDRACAFFVRYRQSRQGIGKDFATMSRNRTRRGMNEQTSSWLSAVEGLPDAHRRINRVVIFSQNACDLIQQEDGSNTLFYLDPPYLAETRSVPNCYEFEMSIKEHFDLLQLLSGIAGKFLLSGYRSKLYDEQAKKFGWNRKDFLIDNKASSSKTKPIKTECVWTNY